MNHYLLSTQLQLLWTKFIECDEKTLPGIINYLKHCSDVDRYFFSEIPMVLSLYLVFPVKNVVNKRSGSTMQRIKNWLRRMMTQERLNGAMLLLIKKESTDKLDLTYITNMFCKRNDERQGVFGVFWKNEVAVFRKRSLQVI